MILKAPAARNFDSSSKSGSDEEKDLNLKESLPDWLTNKKLSSSGSEN